jgi:NAD(P)-dependent dehydrogenase (short-subunit alcohol dehydrogenase family)
MNHKIRVVVLGGSGGVGSAVINYLNRPEIELIGTYFSNKPNKDQNIIWINLDTTSFKSLKAFFIEISKIGKIDAVIDCTGISQASTFEETSFDEIQSIIQTNLVASLWIAKLSLEYLSEKGLLLLFSSIATKTNPKGAAIYSISKAGIEQSISTLSSEFISKNKRINCIRLGYTEYGMQLKIKENIMKKIESEIPIGRLGNITELGFMIDYLLDQRSGYANGTILTLSGGL